MDATGTIIGLRKKLRKALFMGMRHSSISASRIASTTLSGTATAEKLSVFFAAILNTGFLMRFRKF